MYNVETMLDQNTLENYDNSEPERLEQLEFNSLSFIMTKPDSRENSLDILIEDIIVNQKFDLPGLTTTDIENLSKVTVVGRFLLKLTPESSVLDIVYEREVRNRNFEFLNRLKTFYSGDVTFYILVSSLSQNALEEVLNKLKGSKALLNNNGDIIKHPVGIRGRFLKPSKALDLSNPETKKDPSLYVNLLHTSDNLTSSKRILQMYLENSSCMQTENVRAKLIDFLNNHNEDSAF
jgi:hypothetical protein